MPTFQLNAAVVIGVKVKEVQTNVAIYALLRIHVIGGQRLLRNAAVAMLLSHLAVCGQLDDYSSVYQALIHTARRLGTVCVQWTTPSS